MSFTDWYSLLFMESAILTVALLGLGWYMDNYSPNSKLLWVVDKMIKFSEILTCTIFVLGGMISLALVFISK